MRRNKKSEDCLKEVSSFNGEESAIEDENGIHKYKMEFDPTCIGIENTKYQNVELSK